MDLIARMTFLVSTPDEKIAEVCRLQIMAGDGLLTN